MLLALDVGNTNVVAGLYDGTRLAAQWRVSTAPHRTADELHALWDGLFRTRGRSLEAVDGVCLASVVPSLTGSYQDLTTRRLGLPLLMVSTEIDLGIEVDTDNPPEVGADRIMNALAARERYGAPAVVADFGTSTNFDVVSPTGTFIGGVIAPGMATSVEALVARTAQLHRIALQRPDRVIGRNTTACMQSGAFFGYVGLVEGILNRILAELGGDPAVIGTGGLASVIASETTCIPRVDPDLTLEGIRLVWERNRPRAAPPRPPDGAPR
jgi:type III pantothenate kinase